MNEVPGASIVTISRWRNEIGHVRSTVVGKVTLELGASGRFEAARPDPFVAADRPAHDPRFVAEASELMPFVSVASIVLYGGPARLTVDVPGAQWIASSSAPDAPVGLAESSPERSAYALERPVRGIDGLFTIGDDVDGRYFVAAPRRHHGPSLRGDESFLLELGPRRFAGRLPGGAIAATLQSDSALRLIALTPDLLVVDARRGRISIVSRAVVAGPVTLLSQAVVPLTQVGLADRGEPSPKQPERAPSMRDAWPFGWVTPTFDEQTMNQTALMGDAMALARAQLTAQTADMSPGDLASIRGVSTPFPLPTPAPIDFDHTVSVQQVPATPFDPGFLPAAVIPAAGVVSTLTPDEEMARELQRMRAELRKSGAPAPPPSDPPPGTDKRKPR